MTDNNHPITPPPELVEQWMHEASGQPPGPDARVIATQAARWGADEQLEMDATWVALQTSNQMSSKRLIAEMRPKPLSLKEQALQALDLLKVDASTHGLGFDSSAIRRDLEALPMSETKVVELPKPDYALIYAKLARHVAAADALLNHCNDSEASKEMEEAMQAIATFERTFATPAFVIAVEAPPNV